MMKGLFAYKSAYVNYTGACIKDFVEDNIQYAEVRPNFMTTNQLKTDDGSGMLNNEDIMRILDDGVKSTLAEIKQEGGYFAEWVFFEFLFLFQFVAGASRLQFLIYAQSQSFIVFERFG